MTPATGQIDSPSTPSPPFVVNVLWSWFGVAVNVFIGIVVSRYVIRKLGEERYGIWALVFAMLDYLWFFDLGFNTAVTNFCARFRALGEPAKINEAINTALAYFSVVGVILMALAVLVSRNIDKLFPRISPDHRSEFSMLVLVTGLSWSCFVLLHIFTSSLDGFQRFDLTTRSWVAGMVVRAGGFVAVLAMGYGIVAMGIVAVAGQLLGYLLNLASFRRVFPALRLSPKLARVSMMKDMVRYGAPALMANASALLLNQSAPVLIGRYRSVAEVGFFTLPARLLQYSVDAVSRVGLVTRSNAAERDASGQRAAVLQLGIYSNRYCFMLFVPLVLFLLVYGRELIGIWITPSYAEHSAPLLPILAPAIALVMAGQFNSSSILFGLGRHGRYAYGLMVEAAVSVAAMLFVIPRYGIAGAAGVTAVLMLGVRGLYAPWLVCRSLGAGFGGYMQAIYGGPLLAAAPVLAGAFLVKTYWLAGRGWGDLIAAGALVAAAYLGLAWLTCLEPEHRRILREWIEKRI